MNPQSPFPLRYIEVTFHFEINSQPSSETLLNAPMRLGFATTSETFVLLSLTMRRWTTLTNDVVEVLGYATVWVLPESIDLQAELNQAFSAAHNRARKWRLLRVEVAEHIGDSWVYMPPQARFLMRGVDELAQALYERRSA